MSLIQPFWDQIQQQVKREVRPKQYDTGVKLYLSGKVRVTSLNDAGIQIEVQDKGRDIYQITIRRESMRQDIVLRLINLIFSDITILQSVLQGRTPPDIMGSLFSTDLYFQIASKTSFVNCTCTNRNRFCRHAIASVHLLVTEMPENFRLFLAFCGFDPSTIYQIIHDRERRERRCSTTYHDFWIGSDDPIIGISPLTSDEQVPPGIWHRDAPPTVEQYIADIEETRMKVITSAAGILKKNKKQQCAVITK